MPFLAVTTSVPVTEERSIELANKLCVKLSELLDKPRQWMMGVVQGNVPMVFGEKPGNCCCIQIHNIGILMPAESQMICERVCDLLSAELSLPPERIYLIFRPVDGHHWGWNHTTFA